MIDCGTVPPPHALQAFLMADVPVISGVVPVLKEDTDGDGKIKRIPMTLRYHDEKLLPYLGEGVERIDVCGAACLMIKMEVFKAINGPPWFTHDPGDGGREDFRFCEALAKAGIPLYAHFDVHCQQQRMDAVI
jgi:hypothetical protein